MAITDAATVTLAHNLAAQVGWSVTFFGAGSGRILFEGPEVNNVSPAIILTYDGGSDNAIGVGAKIIRIHTWITNMQANAPVT